MTLFFVLASASILQAQDCPEIISTDVPLEIPLGGKLTFNAVGEGGSGNCQLRLEIRKNEMGALFQFVSSVSNGPGKTLFGFSTLLPDDFPAGNYILRFTYECDGDADCEPDIVESNLAIVAVPGIINEEITTSLCQGGRLDHFAEAFGGGQNCLLKMEIRPKGVGSFVFLASTSGPANLKLQGSTTLSAVVYPPGEYEIRLSYTCDDELIDEEIIVIVILTPPTLKADARLEYEVCSNEPFSVQLDELFEELPDGYSLLFQDIDGNPIENPFTKTIENKTKLPLTVEYTIVPLSCVPSNCLTDFRVGGQPLDQFIGPTCSGDGTYRTCFYLTGTNLPDNIVQYTAEINGVTYSPIFC